MLTLVEFKPEHAEAIFAMNCADPTDTGNLVKSYTSEGSLARSIMCISEPIACGGIVNIGWNRGEAWLLVSPLAVRYRKTLIAWSKQCLPELARLGGFRRVQATCFGFMESGLFSLLGFEREGLMKCFGPAGQDALMFSRIFGGA